MEYYIINQRKCRCKPPLPNIDKNPEWVLLSIMRDLSVCTIQHTMYTLQMSKMSGSRKKAFLSYFIKRKTIPMHPFILMKNYEGLIMDSTYMMFMNERPYWYELYPPHIIRNCRLKLLKHEAFIWDIMNDVLSRELSVAIGKGCPDDMPQLWSSLALLDLIKQVVKDARLDI